ncbi:MAG: Kiwa anti-phage protein KwaB-like domain-containing protein, partial [Blautia wexlerae]
MLHRLRDWKDKFEENQEGLIVLNTYQQVEDLIDLLDERYTRSDVTNQEYDTDVK